MLIYILNHDNGTFGCVGRFIFESDKCQLLLSPTPHEGWSSLCGNLKLVRRCGTGLYTSCTG